MQQYEEIRDPIGCRNMMWFVPHFFSLGLIDNAEIWRNFKWKVENRQWSCENPLGANIYLGMCVAIENNIPTKL